MLYWYKRIDTDAAALQTRCDVLRGKEVDLRSEAMRLRDAEEAERERLAAAEADVVRVRENLEIATAERAAMQDALQASKKRLVEAYDEQSERKRALKKTEQELELQNVQLEEQKKKMQEMVARRKAEVGAIEAEMNKLRAESQQISEGQKQWLQQVCVCVCVCVFVRWYLVKQVTPVPACVLGAAVCVWLQQGLLYI